MRRSINRFHRNEKDMEWKFYLSRLEEFPTSYKNFYSNQNQSYFAIFYFLEGTGTHWIDFQAHSIEPNSLFFLNPKQVHSWKFESPVKGYVLKIYPEDLLKQGTTISLLENFRFFQNINRIAKIRIENAFQIKFDFERILREREAVVDKKMLYLLVQLLLYQILIEYNENYSNVYQFSSFSSQIIYLIDKNYQKEKTIGFYSRKLKLTKDQVETFCMKYFGKNLESILFDRTILQIKRLLVHSDMNPMEIALYTGFEDISAFRTFFKLYTKTSIDEFKITKR
ncbi:helix-turn-helix domain-containing protein [Leptospira terpstrae]|uniref:DNA-binding helix-turn-helix protein n=1 Tax=Leptospira terpstrae serovar Hualin str. LT 11-33 = ATCC 700639 TaxID=1257025 RepID=N1VTF1_9LEPT|nr:AraC family transcriptional regulator [Leptospira terpstrae]EMY60247.1 DNA-binding helix-turn-helix protein [Leptospira terpstrae serovar Hualin str. LT 11-33 = ATCC 700639]